MSSIWSTTITPWSDFLRRKKKGTFGTKFSNPNLRIQFRVGNFGQIPNFRTKIRDVSNQRPRKSQKRGKNNLGFFSNFLSYTTERPENTAYTALQVLPDVFFFSCFLPVRLTAAHQRPIFPLYRVPDPLSLQNEKLCSKFNTRQLFSR